ncbi:hypothetical protein BST83_13225 [Polaribacter filamentus]|uniref:Uncharacterized protein n=1 Tax=Polaribacter filamentus TaxID=53483 RepID=A0A2S7KZI4_9FLAO|nr:hypothetical protein [Polaribacter filamentus]PQB08006.1 hypothetical protein BST83_13225 [Polaribacter filamentus]
MNQVIQEESKKANISLELVMATAIDLKEIDYIKELPNDEFKPVYKIKKNMPFWIKSMVNNEIETKCYFLDDHTNQKDLKIFLDAGRIFIHHKFKKL